MNPKDYAKYLIESFKGKVDDNTYLTISKKCALFTVQQLKNTNAKPQTNSHLWNKMEYWEQVEIEIQSYNKNSF